MTAVPALSRRALLTHGAALVLLSGQRVDACELHEVTIGRMSFGAAPVAPLKVGDKVTFLNGDVFRHTATARDGSFDLDLEPGASGQATLTTAGQVEVYCRYHPGMKLTLTVAV